MLIIKNNIIPFKGYNAINVCGVLFVREGVEITPRLIQHEKIHTKQMLEMFIVLFYLVYCVEFLYRYIKQKPNGRSRWNQAYRAISFEREAYFNESRPNYFALREPYQWVTYM